MFQFRCNECGKYIPDKVTLSISELYGITKVVGKCKEHGKQDVTAQEWNYEDFFPNE